MNQQKLKRAVALMLLVVVTAVNSLPAFAESETAEDVLNTSVVMKIGSSTAYVNNAEKTIDENPGVKPEIKNGRTFVPVRFISENFDADVTYDTDNKAVTVALGENNASIKIGSAEMTVNGEQTVLDAEPYIYEDRTFVPLRAITEAIGKKVYWYSKGLIVIGDRESIDDGIAEELNSKFGTVGREPVTAEVVERDAETYFAGSTGIRKTFATGRIFPREATIEMTVKPKNDIYGFTSSYKYAFLMRFAQGTPLKNRQIMSFFIQQPPDLAGRWSTANATERFAFNATNFTFEKDELFNLAVTWKENGKMGLFKNGELVMEGNYGSTFPDYLEPYDIFFDETYYDWKVQQIRISSKSLDESELSHNPAEKYSPTESTTMIIDNENGRLGKEKFYTSKEYKEAQYSNLIPAFRKDKQIFLPDENVLYPVTGINYSDSPKDYTVKLKAVNTDGATVMQKDVNITLPNDEKHHAYEIYCPEITEVDYYYITCEITDGTTSNKWDSNISIFREDNSIPDGERRYSYGTHATEDDDFSIYEKGNATITRYFCYWNDIEAEKGKPNYEYLDEYVDHALAAGIDVMPILGGIPEWAAEKHTQEEISAMNNYVPDRPRSWKMKDMDGWYNFVYQIVSRYKGRVKYWEIWNEPNYHPPYTNSAFGGTTEDMIEIMRLAYAAAKSADPDCIVTSPGLAGYMNHGTNDPEMTKRIAELAGTPGYYDAFNIHGYEAADTYKDVIKIIKDLNPDMPIIMSEEMPFNIANPDLQAYSMVDKFLAYTDLGCSKYIQMGQDVYEIYCTAWTMSPVKTYHYEAIFQSFYRKCNNDGAGHYSGFTNESNCSIKHYFKRTDGKYVSIIGSSAVKGKVQFTTPVSEAYNAFGKRIEVAAEGDGYSCYNDQIIYLISDEPLNITGYVAANKNSLTNGGFEDNLGDLAAGVASLTPTGWEYNNENTQNNGKIEINDEANSGKYALLMTAEGGKLTAEQELHISEPGEYKVKANIKKKSGNPSVSISIYDSGTQDTSVQKIKNITTDYKEKTVSFKMNPVEGCSQKLIVEVDGGSVLVDDFALETAGSAANNLVSNGDFEDGIKNWTKQNTGDSGASQSVYFDAITNSNALLIKATTGTARVYVTGGVKITSPGTYRVTAKVKKLRGANAEPYVRLYNPFDGVITEEKVTELYGYKYTTVSFTQKVSEIPGGDIWLILGLDNSIGEVLFDDVRVDLVQ